MIFNIALSLIIISIIGLIVLTLILLLHYIMNFIKKINTTKKNRTWYQKVGTWYYCDFNLKN